MTAYRERYYEQYGRIHLGRTEPITPGEQQAWFRVYSYYLRGWFPTHPSSPILDVACGRGHLLAAFKRKGFQNLHGVERDPSQIEGLRQLIPDVVQADAVTFLEQHPESYELITAIDFIEHLTKEEVFPFLDACLRALRPGGRLVLQTPNGESPWVGSVFHGDFTHEQCFTPHSLEKLLTLCGFQKTTYRLCGPVPQGAVGTLRFAIWQTITQVCKLLNRIEGTVSSGVYTRVFLISGRKPSSSLSE